MKFLIRMRKRMSPHGDYDHMGEAINLVNNLENSQIYRTTQDGSVMFKIKKDRLSVDTCPP